MKNERNNAVFFLIAIGMILPATVVFADTHGEISTSVSTEINFTIDDLSVTTVTGQDGNSYDMIKLSDGVPLGIPGYPDLPIVTKQFVIPTDKTVKDISIEVRSVKVLPGIYNVIPAQKPEKTDGETQNSSFMLPNQNSYQSTHTFPEKIAEIAHEGFFGKDHIVSISLCPFHYSPKTGELQYLTSVRLQVILEGCSYQPLRQSSIPAQIQYHHDALVQLLVENDEDILSFRSLADEDETRPFDQHTDHTQYLIITNEALAPAFEALRSYKTNRGMPAEIVFVSLIEEVSVGEDTQAKIRNYLIDRYNHAPLEYVLLGGDENIVPIRLAYHMRTSNMPPAEDQQACDLYYSDLTGDWDVDGDGVYGEPTDDNSDIYPEVFVGRIPASTPAEVTTWITKLKTFEMNPVDRTPNPESNRQNPDTPEGSISPYSRGERYDHLMRTLFIAADQMTAQPAVVAEVFPDYFYTDIDTCIEKPSGGAPYPKSPFGSQVIQTMDQGWQFINVLCHGNPDNYASLTHRYNEAPKSYVWGDRERNEGSDPIPELNGALSDLIPQCPTITYSISCDTTWIDWSHCPYGWITARSQRCIGTAAVLMPAKSDVAYLGNSRWGWCYSSYFEMKKFYELIFDQQQNWPEGYTPSLEIGVLHAISKTYFPAYRDINYGHLLLGDPAMRVWSEKPDHFHVGISSSSLVPDDSNTYIIQTGVPGALACIRFPAENYYIIEIADEEGAVKFQTRFTQPGQITIMITASNYIPYEESWWISNYQNNHNDS